ncbi:MAG TPA: hypothetical protein VK078_06510 [Pseudogracilibacillus sp.]|nr:hypothetical protein [Pseudogracilibacillus sp.]
MQCTNCAKIIKPEVTYYVGGYNKTVFCSYGCVREMYDELYAAKEIDKTIEKRKNSAEH